MRNRYAAIIVLATLGLQPDAGARDKTANRADGQTFVDRSQAVCRHSRAPA